MDPYPILRVRRDCTRTELREAFRKRARLAHPDHGGDEKQFVRVCTAYKMILAELDSAPEGASSSRAAKEATRPASADVRPGEDPYMTLLRKLSSRSDAGRSNRQAQRSDAPYHMSIGEKLSLTFAVLFFLVMFAASWMSPDNRSNAPATAGRFDEGTNVRAPGQFEPATRGVQADYGRDSGLPDLPPFPIDGRP